MKDTQWILSRPSLCHSVLLVLLVFTPALDFAQRSTDKTFTYPEMKSKHNTIQSKPSRNLRALRQQRRPTSMHYSQLFSLVDSCNDPGFDICLF